MMLCRRFALALLAFVALVPAAQAENASPVQLSLFSPIQIVAPEKSVSGVRLNLIYGKNVDVTGIDWGLVNHNTGNGYAWQSGFVNVVEKDFTGLQEGVVNMTNDLPNGFRT